MDINKKRLPSTDLQKLIKPLIFKNSRIELLGSAGLESQQYYSDYDLYSVVKERLTPEEAYNECIRILDGVEREPNIFLVEYKIQRKDGSKDKFYNDDTLQGRGLFSSIKKGFNTVKNKVSNVFSSSPKPTFTFNDDFPPLSVMYNIIDNAYKQKGRDKVISGYELIHGTATLVFYKKGDIILVGVRGTADTRDTKADLLIPLGKLDTSARYKEDVEVMKNIHQKYPDATYYGVGHSLGSAVVDLFLHEGLLNQAVSYNGAVEKRFLNNNNNKRIYISSDPLYNTMGRFASNVEVREKPNQSLFKKVLTNTSGLGLAYKTGTSHLLSNFAGGKKKKGKSVSASHNYRDKIAFMSAFHNVLYIKMDFIVRINNIFKELSIIYNLNTETPPSKVIQDLNTEIKDNIKDKNYYKALKRLFSLYKAEGQTKKQLPLSVFFNSEVGRAYETVSNLKAINLLLHHHQGKEVKKKIRINLKDLHMAPSIRMIDPYIKAYTDIIQREAKQVWIKEKGASPEKKKRQVKKLTVKALRQIVREDGLQKKFRGYSRWKRNMLITALAQVGYI